MQGIENHVCIACTTSYNYNYSYCVYVYIVVKWKTKDKNMEMGGLLAPLQEDNNPCLPGPLRLFHSQASCFFF